MNLFTIRALCLVAAALATFGLVALRAEESHWHTDMQEALKQAQKEKKRVLLYYSGSDWCPWCKKAQEELLSTPQFQQYAARNLILLHVDFPRKKQLPEEQLKKNNLIKEKYALAGFPTFVVLTNEGGVLDVLNYKQGGPGPFLAELEKSRR
jgi:protein disulfide-isomerase